MCIYIYMYIFKPSTYNIFYLHSSPAVPSVPFHIAANCTAHCRTWGLFTPWRRPSQRRGASRSSLHCRFCGLFLPVAGFQTYIYIYVQAAQLIEHWFLACPFISSIYMVHRCPSCCRKLHNRQQSRRRLGAKNKD